MGSFRVGAVLGAALLLITACSTKQQGTPTAAADTNTSVPPTGKTTGSAKPSVNRPKTIDLKTTDSCKIMNGMSAAEFGWQGKKTIGKPSVAFASMTDCDVLVSGEFSAGVTAVTNVGVDDFTRNGQAPGVTPVTIGGFPGFTFLAPSGAPGICFAGMDVADGQMLYVYWNSAKVAAERPADSEICTNAVKVAEGALKVAVAS
ncbi:DUF3558 family protein [Actinocrispum sp. NPDC049592]|uniref:DUF3558 family protein n=1 Tax=Actinocrispum sp. NPDC049592 TaxID=3154835 RepID=UPI00341E9F97